VQSVLNGSPITVESDETRFAKTVDLRVAEIRKIERHPKADKLYIETLDIGGEERVIVSGLVPFYTEDQLLGKRIIVVYNLKAAKLRGIESKGMLLAASSTNQEGTETVDVLDAGDAATGTRVHLCSGASGSIMISIPDSDTVLPEIDIDTFFSIPIKAQANRVLVGSTPICVDGKELHTLKVSDGEVG
jgi:methionyl-tRNA synthetase